MSDELSAAERHAGETIDRLVSADVTNRGVVDGLYSAARAAQGDDPLTARAANLLARDVDAGDVVLIVTGWPDRPWISEDIAELDGPPGAIALARAVHVAFTAAPVIVCEAQLIEPLRQGLRGAGLYADLTVEQAVEATDTLASIHGAAVVPLPTDLGKARERAQELFDSNDVAAVVSVEKGGLNEAGEVHNMSGNATGATMAKADALMEEAANRDVPTVGIGDGGNEIGMGVIQDYIRENLPYGRECQCSCGGGLAPATETDGLVAACISNWGAYGVAAALAVQSADSAVLHDPETERRILRECANAGLIDGISGWTVPGADGLGVDANVSFVRVLNAVVEAHLSERIQS